MRALWTTSNLFFAALEFRRSTWLMEGYTMRVAVTLLAILFAAIVSYGEEQSQVPKKMVKELQSLAGTWDVEGRIGNEKIGGTWSAR